MSKKPFDREVFNQREKLISGDFNLMQSYSDLAVREFILHTASPRTSVSSDILLRNYGARFASDGFKVRPASPFGMSVVVGSGLGVIANSTDVPTDIDSISGLNDTSALKPVVLAESQEFIVPDNAGVLTRIDIIEVAYNRDVTDTQTRDILNQTSGSFLPGAVDKTLSWGLDGLTGNVVFPASSSEPLSYKRGPATGAVPPTTSGYTKIAEIVVAPGATTIEESNIADFRKIIGPYGQIVVAATIQLPNLNVTSPSQLISNLKPTIVSLSAPAGMSVSCYPVTNKKTFDFVITGNFSSVAATVRAVGSFDETSSALSELLSMAVDTRIRSAEVSDIGASRASSMANSSIADPVLSLPETQRAAIINFCPYQIVLSGSDIGYKTIVGSTDADPMTVSLIAVLQY